MGILSRLVFREILSGALLGGVLFTFVLSLQRVGRLFELMVRSSASLGTIVQLFALVLPFALTFTIPIGVLVGVLIGLSRMSSDGEITAMRAGGQPSRKVLGPVALFATLAMLAAATCTLWLTPFSIRLSYQILNRLAASQVTAEIQPRVFEEQFSGSNIVLYVGDVIRQGKSVLWRQIFLADLTPPDERKAGARDQGEGPRITVASEAVALSDPVSNRIQLSMLNGSSHEAGKESSQYFNTAFPRGDQTLEARRPDEVKARPFVEMDLGPLWHDAYRRADLDPRSRTAARIELHQRLALPFACILLALVGIPLGVSTRKAGKSTAFVLTVFLAFLYYMGLISLIGLAREGTLAVEVAAWTPNALFAIAGLILMARLEKPGEHDAIGAIRSWFAYQYRRVSGHLPTAPGSFGNGSRAGRFPLLPQLIDTYILSSFIFYFLLLLLSFVLMAHVFFFFELLSDIIKNRIPMSRVLTYFFFLTPKLVYDSTPVSVLVAVLVTFGILTKQNEVTAMKACGISLHRLAVPVLLTSGVLSAGLFAFDHYYVPEANRIQDAIRNEIKGRPVQTYLRPDRKWIFGQGSRIYYYRHFDQAENVMVGVSVYELDPKTFRLRRHIWAERARWEWSLKSWIFQNGWTRDIDGVRVSNYRQFQATTFPELDEPPGYFLKEVKQDKQMNFQELDAYIRELRQSGFDTVKLQVQFYKKFSVPLFALIMAAISVPFAFLTGNRGAMAGVGVSFGIAIAYWGVGQLFEQFGNVNQLPPALAAWSPDALFALAGLYLLMRMRT